MKGLAAERCLNHPGREAAARCPVCRRHFCRECVTEHDGRMLCASCIALGAKAVVAKPRRGFAGAVWAAGGQGLRLAAGVLGSWVFFYLLGQAFALWPSATHAVQSGVEASASPDAAAPAPETDTR